MALDSGLFFFIPDVAVLFFPVSCSQSIGDCTKLEKFSISNNELEIVPGSIARLTHLRELDLSHNAGD